MSDLESVIVDAESVLDTRIATAVGILQQPEKNITIEANQIRIEVNRAPRKAVQIQVQATRQALLDAMNQAGLTVLENVKRA